MIYKVGTRDSKLALKQTELVCHAIVLANPELSIDQFELVKIKTIGDKITNKPLVEIGGKNLFIKEIEEALISRKIHFAVHSLKDMTAKLDPRLTIAACLEREDPTDAFVSLKYKHFSLLPKNAVIGTSSIRRKSMLLHYRPDLEIVNFRGNVIRRLEKLGQVDATLLATAGLKRLNIDKALYSSLSITEFMPAISQGVIAVESRKDDHAMNNLLYSINHKDTEVSTQAERGVLEAMEADCNVPVAAYARIIDEENLFLEAMVIDDRGKIYKEEITCLRKHAYRSGAEVGLKLKTFL
jgi:hydroxymethylbilane synthase